VAEKDKLAQFYREQEAKKSLKAQNNSLIKISNKYGRPYQLWETSSLAKNKLDWKLLCGSCFAPVMSHWRLMFDDMNSEQGRRRYCRRDGTAWWEIYLNENSDRNYPNHCLDKRLSVGSLKGQDSRLLPTINTGLCPFLSTALQYQSLSSA